MTWCTTLHHVCYRLLRAQNAFTNRCPWLQNLGSWSVVRICKLSAKLGLCWVHGCSEHDWKPQIFIKHAERKKFNCSDT